MTGWASREVCKAARAREYRTFAVGLTLPQGVQEREDEIRASLKMKGGETIKLQLSREIAESVGRATGKKVDRLKPDITALVDLSRMKVSISGRPLFYTARYTKPRGVSQRRGLCQSCGGRGCKRCGGSGFDPAVSVESLFRRKLSDATGTDSIRITWMGSEDEDSEVLAPGRPLVVEMKNPVKRRLPRSFRMRSGRGWVSVSKGRVLPSKPANLPGFKFRTRIAVEVAQKPDAERLGALKGLAGSMVRFDRPHGRAVSKKVYSLSVAARRGGLWVTAELDGGLPVKRFVNGDLVSPSVSEALGMDANASRFDILRVTEKGKMTLT